MLRRPCWKRMAKPPLLENSAAVAEVHFRYFLVEIEELEQKSNLEAEKALQMLSEYDLPALRRAFLELQKSK